MKEHMTFEQCIECMKNDLPGWGWAIRNTDLADEYFLITLISPERRKTGRFNKVGDQIEVYTGNLAKGFTEIIVEVLRSLKEKVV